MQPCNRIYYSTIR